MSYDVSIINKDTNKEVTITTKHQIRGGTYCLGGTNELSVNITYNYSPFFKKVLGDKGIRVLNGMEIKESIPLLEEAISKLGDDVDENYWAPTEGNAKEALINLVQLAKLCPEYIDAKWEVI